MSVDTSKGNEGPKNLAIYEHIADYIIQTLIKEDVNAYAEAKLLHDLLMYKMPPVALELMKNTVSAEAKKLKKGGDINLMKEIGGINMQKRLHFRSKDQYNSFIALFFETIDLHNELLGAVDDEEKFERFMILCIHEFRQKLEDFAIEIAKERSRLEHEHKVYIHRKNVEVPEIPTYADFIAERIESLAE